MAQQLQERETALKQQRAEELQGLQRLQQKLRPGAPAAADVTAQSLLASVQEVFQQVGGCLRSTARPAASLLLPSALCLLS